MHGRDQNFEKDRLVDSYDPTRCSPAGAGLKIKTKEGSAY